VAATVQEPLLSGSVSEGRLFAQQLAGPRGILSTNPQLVGQRDGAAPTAGTRTERNERAHDALTPQQLCPHFRLGPG
jgi:hypothetical protein